MKILRIVLILTIASLFCLQLLTANPADTGENNPGEKLLQQLWSDMAAQNVGGIEKTISPAFQSVHQNGSSNRDQELELIKGLKLGEYTLSDVKITRDGPVIVATYFVSVEETIDGKRLSKKPAPRMSVFYKTDGGWKWIAHANLKPIN